jgi:hypothetical protein
LQFILILPGPIKITEEIMIITKHAIKRFQQRGISLEQVKLIVTHGKKIHRPGNAYLIRLTKKVIQKKERNFEVSSRQILDNITKIGLILDSEINSIITGYIINNNRIM